MSVGNGGSIRPVGNFFAEDDFIHTDVRLGVSVNRAGTRMCSLSSDFLKGLLTAITHECGPAAGEVLGTAGRRWGLAFGKRLENELSEFYGQPVRDFPLALFQACVVEAFSHHGWGKLNLDFGHEGIGLIVAEMDNPIYGSLVEKSEQPADPMLAGILAGFFAHFSGQDLECVQTDCVALGHDRSRFIIGLGSRLAKARVWRGEGKGHAAILQGLAEVRA